jgi:glutamyl-tRNA reductase
MKMNHGVVEVHIIVIGLNYNTASVEIRERFAFNEETKVKATQLLQKTKSIQECVIVGTCNRTEVYAVVDQLHVGRHYIKSFLAEWFGTDKSEFVDYLYIKENTDAVRHLFRVTCGLDSMVLGETQILGQVRDSFIQSQNLKSTGTVFNMLFKQAITLAKQAHSKTDIGKNAVSVSYAAIELGKKFFEHFHNKTVVILGAGKMGELTAKHLYENGVSTMIVVNRTYERARNLADKFSCKALNVDQLSSALIQSDIVICSVGVEDHLITKQEMEAITQKRNNRSIFIIDIAVPRSIDPKINDLNNVFLYDIDDLQGIVESNLQGRAREAEKIEYMIEQELVTFNSWLNTLGVIPVIAALREKSLAIHEEALRHIENKLPDLTEKELKIIRKYSKTIVNQMLHYPLVRMKEMVANVNQDEVLNLFIKIFAVEEEMQKQSRTRQRNIEPEIPDVCHPERTVRKIAVHS